MIRTLYLLLAMSFAFSAQAQNLGMEFGPTGCIDGLDNDNDGLIDCEDPDCSESTTIGCAICPDGISYADVVIDYRPGCPLVDPQPDGAIGAGDWDGTGEDGPEVVFLGQGGSMKLGFTDNVLTNSGSVLPDLHIFEVGLFAEECLISLRPEDEATRSILIAAGVPDPEGDNFFLIGTIVGTVYTIDIDAAVPGFPGGALRFNAVEITDVDSSPCSGGVPGADIDAICALTTLPAPDCGGTPGGSAVVDACGVCLQPNDPLFNLSCADCAGTPAGSATIDSCGVCLGFMDNARNQSCRDCEGVLFGAKMTDGCGQCLDPSNPDFDQACADCNGVPNGQAILDRCGVCLEPEDPRFDISCGDPDLVYRPSAFSPNGDGINDAFVIYAPAGTTPRLVTYRIFDRWGGAVYELSDQPFSAATAWWDGRARGEMLPPGIYAYVIEVEFQTGRNRRYDGVVQLVR